MKIRLRSRCVISNKQLSFSVLPWFLEHLQADSIHSGDIEETPTIWLFFSFLFSSLALLASHHGASSQREHLGLFVSSLVGLFGGLGGRCTNNKFFGPAYLWKLFRRVWSVCMPLRAMLFGACCLLLQQAFPLSWEAWSYWSSIQTQPYLPQMKTCSLQPWRCAASDFWWIWR